MTVEAGKTYYGPGNQRLTVLEIVGDQVTVLHPMTLRQGTRTLAEMEEFAAGSNRRHYYHPETNDILRTKIAEDDDHVTYQDSEGPKKVTHEEWQQWRDAL